MSDEKNQPLPTSTRLCYGGIAAAKHAILGHAGAGDYASTRRNAEGV